MQHASLFAQGILGALAFLLGFGAGLNFFFKIPVGGFERGGAFRHPLFQLHVHGVDLGPGPRTDIDFAVHHYLRQTPQAEAEQGSGEGNDSGQPLAGLRPLDALLQRPLLFLIHISCALTHGLVLLFDFDRVRASVIVALLPAAANNAVTKFQCRIDPRLQQIQAAQLVFPTCR